MPGVLLPTLAVTLGSIKPSNSWALASIDPSKKKIEVNAAMNKIADPPRRFPSLVFFLLFSMVFTLSPFIVHRCPFTVVRCQSSVVHCPSQAACWPFTVIRSPLTDL
jgi:hypothetical protein